MATATVATGPQAGDNWRDDVRQMFRNFARDEDGAITVDWVVLTALIVGLQIYMLVTQIKSSIVNVTTDVGGTITEYGDFLD